MPGWEMCCCCPVLHGGISSASRGCWPVGTGDVEDLGCRLVGGEQEHHGEHRKELPALQVLQQVPHQITDGKAGTGWRSPWRPINWLTCLAHRQELR